MLADDPNFHEEMSDLRAEIMTTGVLAPALMLGWGAAFVVLFSSLRAPDWPRIGIAVLPLALGLICIALKRTPTRRLSMWLCATGLFGWAMLTVWLNRQPTDLLWLAAACVIATLVGNSLAGWLSVATATGWLIWLAMTGPGQWLSPPQALLAGCALGSLVWLAHCVSRVLFRTLRWMQQGYFEARERARQLSEQSAKLALALKSLKQTSFALEQANEHLRIAVKYAEDARRSKQEFAANISHELRTPLNLIIGFSDVLLRASSTYKVRNLPPGMLADINVIHRNANHLLNLVNDILDLSQMDVNHMTIVRQPMQVREFIESSLADFRELIHERGLTLTLDIAPDLPEVYADQTRIRQVLLNLVANALRFTRAGGITIRARLSKEPHTPDDAKTDELAAQTPTSDRSSHKEAFVVISVSDTGIGIAPEHLERIFEPFTQLDSSLGRQHGGTGLGLTISKQFVQLHGGKMWAESTPGAGSTFSFSLPLHIPTPDAPMLSTQHSIHRRAVGTLAVIESASSVSRILEHRLEGIWITRASSLDELAVQQPDVQPEVFVINQPAPFIASLERPGIWPSEWRRGPIFYCDVPSPEMYLQTELVRCFLMKPAPQSQIEEAMASARAAIPTASRRARQVRRVRQVHRTRPMHPTLRARLATPTVGTSASRASWWSKTTKMPYGC